MHRSDLAAGAFLFAYSTLVFSFYFSSFVDFFLILLLLLFFHNHNNHTNHTNHSKGGLTPNDVGPRSETTMMHGVFGGHTKSTLRCSECGSESNTFEPFMDLSIEMTSRTKYLEQALSEFTAVEHLDKDNKWHCEKCQVLVEAEKQMTIRSAPLNLVLQLKRFTTNGSKQENFVNYPETLHLDMFMSECSDEKRR
jgi:ubiquitin carboxyl-terminal hydrolase 36/42